MKRHDIEQMEKVLPFIVGAVGFRQVIGSINVFDLDLWVQVDSVK